MAAPTVTRVVSMLMHQYAVTLSLPDGSGGFVDRVVWRSASRGETVHVSPAEAERGDAIGAFLPAEPTVPSVPAEPVVVEAPVVDGADDAAPAKELADMTVTELRREAKARGVALGADVTRKDDIVRTIEGAEVISGSTTTP